MHDQFQPSELILNPDGSVYHLHLLPEHVADIIITVGDPDRVEMVSKYFDTIEFKNQKREFITHTGTINGKSITVISTGIGTDNIDIVFNELHILKNYDFEKKEIKPNRNSLTIYRIGTSGCLIPEIPVDSFLVSDFGIGIDNLLHFYRFENSGTETRLLNAFETHHNFHHRIHPYAFAGSAQLIQDFTGNDFYHGITLTGPGFYGPQGRRIFLNLSQQQFYDDLKTFSFENYRVTNFEMETAAMYGLAKLMGHACISLNVLLANRATGEFSKDPHAAVDRLIKVALEKIKFYREEDKK